MVHYDVPYPLGEIVRKILARGDDRAGTMPQESRAWSKKRLAGWRTDQDVAAQLAALTSLDFNQYALRKHRTFNREEEAKQWAIQNNLAHLLEHTPGLKTLHVPLVFAEGGAPFPFAESGWGEAVFVCLAKTQATQLFQVLGKLTDLQALSLPSRSNHKYSPGKVDRINARIWTWDSGMANALACSLKDLPSLVELDLCGNSMPSESADVLALALQHLTGLTRLKLFDKEPIGYDSDVEDEVEEEHITHIGYDVEPDCQLLEAVGSMAGLRSFSMQGFCGPPDKRTELIASALGALAGLTRLEELDMRRNIFSAEAATALAGTLTRLTQLTELTMGQTRDKNGNSLASPEAVAALIAPLTALTSLTKLESYEGPCSPATIETLASALGRMPALTWLDAGDYTYEGPCSPATIETLASALGRMPALTWLNAGPTMG